MSATFIRCITAGIRRWLRDRLRPSVDERLAADINEYERADRAFNRPERPAEDNPYEHYYGDYEQYGP